MIHRLLSVSAAFFLLSVFGTNNACATHNRAGEITWQRIGPNTIRCILTTYTKFEGNAIPADRDSVEIDWGDGSPLTWVRRVNGPAGPSGVPQGEFVRPGLKRNLYITEHTYPGFGHFRIGFTDPNRIADICNVNDPNSVSVKFYIETTVTLVNEQFGGTNNSPLLFQFPIDEACVGQPFKHNPGAFDPDGDSLAFRLIAPLEGPQDDVPLYEFPNMVEPGPANNLSINPVTGDILWDAPQRPCIYNIAILVIDYRNGQPLDSVIRDMQIIVEECDNRPPDIEVIDEICVLAGEKVEFDIVAKDPDVNPQQSVQLSAQGALFDLPSNPAQFVTSPDPAIPPVLGIFTWQTNCEDISDQPYFVVFKAVDNHPNPLADLKTVLIRVIGPPPEDVQAEALTGEIAVSWELPYVCEDAIDEYFRGFSIWRRDGSNPIIPDTCTPGMDGYGYTRIERFYQSSEGGRYLYKDTEVERGRTYCYRIMAEFARQTALGQNYNNVDGLPSLEICTQLARDVPLMTHADVTETDATDGQIQVRWTKPNPVDLDTLQNPGPYTFRLLRSTGIAGIANTPVPGAEFSSPSFSNLTDTAFLDATGLNTENQGYTYAVEFYVNGDDLIENPNAASSIFLTIVSTDNRNILSWEENVPWENTEYVIFRRRPGNATFDSIALTQEPAYEDNLLTNGLEYCYFIRALGTYGIQDFPDSLINLSQIACGTPLDTIAPCSPALTINNLCNTDNPGIPEDQFINSLTWTNPNDVCPETDDVAGYRIYYSPLPETPLSLIATIEEASAVSFEHQPENGIAGCYAVTAVDSFENESQVDSILCVENCPFYELPNVFTPNGDGQNELWVPFPYRFIDHVELKIYNRWGNMVFETENPDILWDGTDQNGNAVTQGTYFYTCILFEARGESVLQLPDILSGFVEVVRGN